MNLYIALFALGILLSLTDSNNAANVKKNILAQIDIRQRRESLHGRTKLDTDKNFYLRVVEKMNNQTATSGDNVIFKCKVKAYPKNNNIKFKWYKNDVLISTDEDFRFYISERRWGSRLLIKSLYTLDAGEYKCKASLGLKNVETRAQLKVTFKLPPPINDNEIYTITIPQSKCEIYRGSICSDFFKGTMISVDPFQNQNEVENKINQTIKLLSSTNSISYMCQKYALPAFCYFVFPQCDNDGQINGKRLCKKDCEKLKSDICLHEYLQSKENPLLKVLFETAECSNLPSSDCSTIGLPALNSVNECYSGVGKSYHGYVNQAISGQVCLPWPEDFTEKNPELTGHNFCRNPNEEFDKPWCFVDVNEKRACDISKCGNKREISLLFLILLIASAGFFFSFFIFVMAWCCYCKNRKIFYRPVSSKKVTSQFKASQVRSQSIHVLAELGYWDCGKIHQGTVTDSHTNLLKQPLACKFFDKSKGRNMLKKFYQEIEIFSNLSHPGITNLKGTCVELDCLCILYEYTNRVDLQEFLLLNSPTADTTKHLTRLSERADISDDLLVEMALQISSGLEYLESKKYVYRDLAAHNILVCEKMTLKINILGGMENSHLLGYCRSSEKKLQPVRWMAPEVVKSRNFSAKSTIWSFGVLLWEMFSYGSQPYCGYDNQRIIDMILSRQLLSCPHQCPPQLYSLMLDCWTYQPKLRPSCSTISKRLEKIRKNVPVVVKNFPFKNKLHLTSTYSDLTEKEPILENFNAV